MKTALLTLLTVCLLLLAAVASGRLVDAADFIAIAFTSGLVAWTFAQYRTAPVPLATSKPIHPPIRAVVVRPPTSSRLQQTA